ncbi:hypothetical protein MMC06_001466 [Schaereria dolodes]|nr:hypothetical protein [Schaereria dolodes]
MASRISKKSTKLRNKPKANLHFLTLPLEIRENVYMEVVHSIPRSLLQLLRTNRQISKEAQPYVFKQPLTFDGQAEFFNWLRSMDRKNLKHVTNIRFKLHDIDPDKIVGALGKRLRQAKLTSTDQMANNHPYNEACEQEVKRISEAFVHLPNVRNFTIIDADQSDPRPSYHMLVCLSNEIARRFEHLQHLSIHVDHLPFNFISKLRRLRSLRTTGFSTSTPAETFAALRQLTHLSSLEVSGPSSDLSFRQRPGYSGPRSVQCITPAVLQGLPNLIYLAIYDPADAMAATSQPVFLVPTLFHVITTHLTSLQTLRLATSHASVSPPTLQKLCALLTTSTSLHRLDLAFPLDFVPSTIRQFASTRQCKDFDATMNAVAEDLDVEDERPERLKELRICVKESRSDRVNAMEEVVKEWVEESCEEWGMRCTFGNWADWFEGI